MKKTYSLLIAILLTLTAYAQSPELFNYQAVVRNAEGEILQEQPVTFQMSILSGSATSVPVYVETHSETTNEFGLVNLTIGSGTNISGTFNEINWGANTYFVKIELDISGGANYTNMGTTQLLSVPYALHAKTVEIMLLTKAERDALTNVTNGSFVYCTDLSGIGQGGLQIRVNNEWVNMSTVSPTVQTTTAASNITSNSATSGGNITDNGGAMITARGVCWSTTTNPTTANTKTTNGTDTGSFTSAITGLTPETTYYVRAYATNSKGTAYGEQQTFTTLPITLPTVQTSNISNITIVLATSGGNITNNGNAEITARGVCWNTTTNPTTADTTTTDGTGTGSFTSAITGLTPETTYYVRAYATNSVGTAYGNEVSFTSQTFAYSSFTDTRDNKTYNTIQIGSQTWMAENLATLPSVSPSANGSGTEPYYYVYDYQGTNVTEAKATDNYATYGVLYNWSAAMSGATSSDANPSGIEGACPSGWHLPSNAEWTELTDYLINNGYGYEGSGSDIGKSMATTGWTTTNDAGEVGNDQASNNSCGFTAVPGGYRSPNGEFFDIGSNTSAWWSSTEYSTMNAYLMHMSCYFSNVDRSDGSKEFGKSIRCVKD